MESIGISPRFFTHELNSYSEWESAFWRELIQNSVDVGCTKINIDISEKKEENNEENFSITFEDNGPGMDEEIMRNVYFQLGATGKEGTDTIGGHGRARILTCFAHQSYEIRTQNLLCKGTGGNFSIENHHPLTKGCSITVRINTKNTNPRSMKDYLIKFLELCQLNCEITINNERFRTWLYKRKATRALSFGSIHTTKQIEGKSIVRVRGVVMFERHIANKTSCILEIEAAKSREVLTVSRDHLKYSYQEELERFITEITLDKNSISRDCSINKTEIYGELKKIGKSKSLGAGAGAGASTTGEYHTTWYKTEEERNAACRDSEQMNPYKTNLEPKVMKYSLHYEDLPKNLHASAKRFHKESISGNRLKLLAAWDATIEFFLEDLCEKFSTEVNYLPGFVFGNLRGMCKAQGDGHLILINPLWGKNGEQDGKINLSCNDIDIFFSLGAHETAHIQERYHDECYASLLTEIIERTAGKRNELKTRIKLAVVAVTNPEDNLLKI